MKRRHRSLSSVLLLVGLACTGITSPIFAQNRPSKLEIKPLSKEMLTLKSDHFNSYSNVSFKVFAETMEVPKSPVRSTAVAVPFTLYTTTHFVSKFWSKRKDALRPLLVVDIYQFPNAQAPKEYLNYQNSMRSVGSISPEHASKILSDKPIGTLQQVVLPYYSPADYRRISKSLLLHEHPFDYGQIETIDGQLYVSAQLLNRPKRWNKDTQAKEDIATLIQATRVTLAKAKGYLHRQQQPVHK